MNLMAAGKEEAIPLPQGARMIGYTTRAMALLVKQGKIESVPAPEPPSGPGRPPIYVSRGSVEEWASFKGRVVREITADEAKGRNASLSNWLSGESRLMGRIRRAGIFEIDGQGERGKVWIRFYPAHTKRQQALSHFWRVDADGVFGSRKFRLTFKEKGADVFVRGHDEREDRLHLARCVTAAVAAVEREERRFEQIREDKKRRGAKKKRSSGGN